MASWYAIRARGPDTVTAGAEVAIYDEIGAYGVSAKGFLSELGALPEGTPVDLRLNSPGGSVFDAVAIHNALKRHEGTVTVWIDGIAASAASYIAMAGDEIVMPENAFLMIHDPAGLVMGTAEDMRAMAGTLDKIAAGMTRGYAGRSGKTEDEIAALMAAETWFSAAEALEAGLATQLAEPVRIAASFDIARFRNAPPELQEAVEPVETADPDSAKTGSDIVEDANDVAAPADATPRPEARDPDGTATDASTGPDPATIRAEAIAHARAVVDLCRLAGQPQMAGRFLEEDASLDAVRAALLDAKAETAPEITPHHPQPGRSATARPWGDVIARTFRSKG
jgi:ATP-dependent Clp protease protease subunit